MRRVFLSVAIACLLAADFVGSAAAGPCTYDSDRASDGSRCGDRSAESRPGGG
jgi:hypothetical protein